MRTLLPCLLLTAFLGAAEDPSPVTSISQYGITWTFDRPVQAGRFITGDWWVVGPVRVVSVSPASGPVEKDDTKVAKTQFNDAFIRPNKDMRNGSMVIGEGHDWAGQGYDSRLETYRKAMTIVFPYELAANRSLISAISTTDINVPNLVHQIMWPSEKKCRLILQSAAILTCLDRAPPPDAFRPAYAGTDKRIYQEKALQWQRLASVKPPMPEGKAWPNPQLDLGQPFTWADVERWFERPWIEHVNNWLNGPMMPAANQPNYGREWGRAQGIASLLLNLDVPRERKRKLLIGLVQLGIDLHGLARAGYNWMADGGGWSGRKWPIVFAGIMLKDAEMLAPPAHIRFPEDQQTYYGTGWCGQTALYQMVTHHGPRRPYEERAPETWDDMDKRSESYRTSSTAQGWIGVALAARLMKAIPEWKHDAFFDYCDRWMAPQDAYAAKRGKHKRPGVEGKTYDPFVDAMWRTYRDQAPAQPWSGVSRKWVWREGNAGGWEEQKRP